MTFLDGPAASKADGLMIRRAPMFLRLVVNAAGKWDALDQLDDKPTLDEMVHVYRFVSSEGAVHLRRSKGSGFFQRATYRYVDPPPPSDQVRVNRIWQEWCRQQAAAAT